MKLNQSMNEKILSVALLLTDGNVFLAVNPLGHHIYDLPKGQVEKGDTLIETLIREIKEEVGIDISRYTSQLIDMGKFNYMQYKDIYVYVLILKDLPPTSKMKCTSMFKMYGREVPEVKDHRYITFKDLGIFNIQMSAIIKRVYKRIKNEIK